MKEEYEKLRNLKREHLGSVHGSWENSEKTIDFVLVHRPDEAYDDERRMFEANLRKAGLQLSSLEPRDTLNSFTQIHAPKHVLLKYCEIMNLQLPLKEISGSARRRTSRQGQRLTLAYSRDKSHLFDVDPFTASVRSMIVGFILSKEKHSVKQAEGAEDSSDDDDDDDNAYGISKLIERGVYEAAYPLHTEHQHLLHDWASLSKMHRVQPLDAIKDYFGVKIALYFAWIGFYTYMLIPASVLGLLYMAYGFFTLSHDNISTEVCESRVDIIMCPQCDKHCDYWPLREICTFSLITHLFDNTSTLIFIVLMSLWSAVYLNMWSRYSTRIVHRWGIANPLMADNEVPAVQYLNNKARYRRGKFGKVQRITLSTVVVMFWLSLVIGVVLALMFYRISLSTSEKIFGVKGWIVIVTGSVFDLITILVLNYLYDYIARWLTERELHRTQAEFDNSLTWKIYLFWFVNYYSSIVYVAFIKGKFIGRPGAYQRVFGFRQEECGPGGCIVDLFIQIAIIMIGDLTFNNIVEYVVPWVQKKYQAGRIAAVPDEEEQRTPVKNQWTRDLKLLHWSNYELSTEYLEMILQYGLVTLFVAAFPLAPLVALLNNVVEIRLDAKKLLRNYRRPVAENAQNIGTWLTIMNVTSRMAILSNACIIAFSTNFVPQIFFALVVSADSSNAGFFNHTLAYFNTSAFAVHTLPIQSQYADVQLCRYPDYRNPPWHEDRYELSKFYWHVLATKLIFVLLYQNVVVVLQALISYVFPEMPRKLRNQMRNEALQTQRLVLRTEARREETTVQYSRNTQINKVTFTKNT